MIAALLLMLMANTPQIPDTLVYGGENFAIQQIPMLGIWDYSEEDLPPGKMKPPEFDLQGSGNWKGYEAKWLIRDSKLYLMKIKAKRDGKRIKNDQIFLGKQFPLHAYWFTGRIHLSVGGYNEQTKKSESVIVFQVEKGVVTNQSFNSESDIPSEWNGLRQDRATGGQ